MLPLVDVQARVGGVLPRAVGFCACGDAGAVSEDRNMLDGFGGLMGGDSSAPSTYLSPSCRCPGPAAAPRPAHARRTTPPLTPRPRCVCVRVGMPSCSCCAGESPGVCDRGCWCGL